jgi:hypothetical protein
MEDRLDPSYLLELAAQSTSNTIDGNRTQVSQSSVSHFTDWEIRI